MNERPDVEFVLRRWFQEGPTRMPDRVLDVVGARISATAQHRGSLVRIGRSISEFPKLLVVAAILVVVAAALVLTAGRPSDQPVETPSTFRTAQFYIPIQLAIPPGWDVPSESRTILQVNPEAPNPGSLPEGWITLAPTAIRLVGKTDCRSGQSGAQDFDGIVSSLKANPSLAVTDLGAMTIDGHRALRLDVELAPSWSSTCSSPNGRNGAPLLVGDAAGLFIDIVGGEHDRFVFIDASAGRTLLAAIGAPPASLESFTVEALPVIESIRFEP